MNDSHQPPPTHSRLKLLERELERRTQKKAFNRAITDTLRVLTVVAAIAVLLSTIWIPVFRTYGNSMQPTLNDGQLIIAFKTSNFSKGDLVAFYFNNKVLIKRVVAHGGDTVEMDEEGVVYVNGEALNEPYVSEFGVGECDIEFPYVVPDGRFFVLGDNRPTSIDSRSSMIGAVSSEQIVGKVTFKVWPFEDFGFV